MEEKRKRGKKKRRRKRKLPGILFGTKAEKSKLSDSIATQTLRGLRLLNSNSSDGIPKDFEMSIEIL